MHSGPFENGIWLLNTTVALAVIVRLFGLRLAGVYRFLTLYLLLDLVEDIVLLALTAAGSHKWYSLAYIAGQTLKVIVGILVPMELFRLALVQQPALARFGRSIIGYLFALAAVLAALNPLIGGAASSKRGSTVAQFFRFERSMDSMEMLVLILMSIFLLWFPLRTRRNAAVCIAGFVVYFFHRWAGLLLVDLWPALDRQASMAMLCVSLACLTAWVIQLRRDGETTTVQTGHGWDPVEAERLTFQLNGINARLARVARDNTPLVD